MVIFDPMGFGGGVGAILETCDASGCMTDPSDSNVSAVAGCGSGSGEQMLAWLRLPKASHVYEDNQRREETPYASWTR